jgi:hypothetical protein
MLEQTRPLPQYTESDPCNLLPRPARLRISRAFHQQQAICDLALAKIHARLNGRQWDDSAREQFSAAKMDAAYAVLSVEVQEFLAIRKKGRELQDIIGEVLGGAANSLELSDLEQRAVWSRLWLVEAATQTASKNAAEITRRPNRTAKVRRAWMDQQHPGWSLVRWREHTGLAYETLKKYSNGITTNRTSSIRGDLARKENVAFSAVPA